jgi:simple sugar transport system permease protein
MTTVPDSSKAPALKTTTSDLLRETIRRGAVFILLAGLVVLFSIAQPAFINLNNLMSILQAVAVVAIIGAGVTVTLAIGGFDLSVGAVAASSVMAASYAMIVLGFNAVETVILVLAFGALVGAINALLIVKLKVPDLLATLAIMFLLTGLQLIPTAGRSISVGLILPDGTTATGKVDPSFLLIGRSSLFGVIPVPVILMILVALALFVFTERTRIGRLLYATGGNEVAARLAGANTARIKTYAYVLSGTLAALGGIIVAARVGRGDVSSGASLLMDSVAASLIGFAVLGLRRPNVLGTVIGAVFVGVLLNGLTMLNAPYYTQDFVKGAVLVGALALTYGVSRTRA